MDLHLNQALIYIFFFSTSLLFILLWAGFFFYYSPKKTTPKNILFTPFLFGIGVSLVVFLFEKLSLSFINIDLSFLQPLFTIHNPQELIGPFLFSFCFIALIEESAKFIILKKYFKIKAVNQVIDGMKIGLWLGFGFVFIENTFYFLNFYSQLTAPSLLINIVLLRGVFSTLAQALYGMIMGYYISLAKFNKLYQYSFLRKGFATSLIVHGFFNFFLIINLGVSSAFMLIAILIVTLIWYNNKKNLELYLYIDSKKLIAPPFLADRIELETLLSKQKAPAEYFRQLLRLFPPEKFKK